MPFILNPSTSTQLRCSLCGRLITGQPIVAKTCCVNRPWTFCSRECYERWVRQWLRNQEAHRLKNVLRREAL